MRDDQLSRYARHIMLPGVGREGQSALLAASARIAWDEPDPEVARIAAAYLAAGGVGTLVLPTATDAQRVDAAAHGADAVIAADGPGRDVVLEASPAWWPGAEGDQVARAFWRGARAAIAWMADTVSR